MKNTKKKDYSDSKVYIGLDVHKNSWEASFAIDAIHMKKARFEKPFVENLVHYAKKTYPNATFICAYEAGFSGFWAKRKLESFGFSTYIVNPCDIPTSGKDRVFKTDKRDSKKIVNALRSGELEPIHCPTETEERDRAILRTRFQIAKVEKQCKNRIKSLLLFYGIDIPEQYNNSRWPKRFINWLDEVAKDKDLICLQNALSMLEWVRKQHASILKSLRQLSMDPKHTLVCNILKSVPGIGPLTSISLKLELISMERFSSTDKLLSYIGLIPTTNNSGESKRVGRMTKRGRTQLRRMLIESAWIAIRHDPELRDLYEEYKNTKTSNKAIVKIAVKLVRQIRYLWVNETLWQTQKAN